MPGKSHDDHEAMIDETLVESFPASDAPSWTLGVDDAEPEILPPKGTAFVTRDALLKLLSDDEVARVSTLETAPALAVGEEYFDLQHIERGILRARAGVPLSPNHVLPRRAVREETWAKLVLEARRGWQGPPGQ